MAITLSFSIIGRLTQDPRLQPYTNADGTQGVVCHFDVAVNYFSGNRQSVQFIRCTTWNKQAQHCAQYLKKGSQVACSGIPSVSAYIATQGANAGKAVPRQELNVNEIQFLSFAPNQSAQQTAPVQAPATQDAPVLTVVQQTAPQAPVVPSYDADVPPMPVAEPVVGPCLPF